MSEQMGELVARMIAAQDRVIRAGKGEHESYAEFEQRAMAAAAEEMRLSIERAAGELDETERSKIRYAEARAQQMYGHARRMGKPDRITVITQTVTRLIMKRVMG